VRDGPWSDLEADNTDRLLGHVNVERVTGDIKHFDRASTILIRSSVLRQLCLMHDHCDVKMVEHMDWSQFFAQLIANWLVLSKLGLRHVAKWDIFIEVVLPAVPSGARQVIQEHPVAIVIFDQLGELLDFFDRPLTLTHFVALLVAVLILLFVDLRLDSMLKSHCVG